MAAAAEAHGSCRERQQQLQARQPAGGERLFDEPAPYRLPEAAVAAAAGAAEQDAAGIIAEEVEDECGPSFELLD